MTSDNRVGEVLASKYRLEELLGSGGMGHVYRAVNQDVGRTVAIKVLRAEHAQNAKVADRFLREARAANLVRHPNVVDVIDVGREDGGAPFIVQELLEGEDLAHLAERRGGKLPLVEIVDIMGPVIDAVAEAHLRGVIHRDLKPENVFLAKGLRGTIPKLLDFGISKVSAPDLQATEVGVLMGTPAYMPPEQVQGARDADPRSDVWALGVMLFELIAGRLPFDARDAPALFVAIATQDAPTLLDVGAEVPAELSSIVARCLRRRPDDRYPSAAELARDLRHVAEGTAIEPTSKRSVPPLALAQHAAAATVPPRGDDATEPGSVALASAPASRPLREIPKAPSLLPPAPRLATAPFLAPGPSPPAAHDLGGMHAAPQLSGIGLAPGPPAAPAQPARAASSAVRRPPPEERPTTDTSGLVGAGVVALVVILGVGILMQLAHRPEGWPLARFVLQPGQTSEVALHGFLGLLLSVVGATYCWRGVRHWRGELSGGPANGIINALVAAAAFFSAIELLTAVT